MAKKFIEFNVNDPGPDRLKEVGVKNAWKWSWRGELVGTQKNSSDTSNGRVGDFIKKLDSPGEALCTICDKTINYGLSGVKDLKVHGRGKKHVPSLMN